MSGPSAAVAQCHQVLAGSVHQGDLTVDGTLGNGQDTVFLAERVGPPGHVYAFDIQPLAIRRASERLQETGLADRVTMFQRGHDRLIESLPREIHGSVAAVVFNLGFLPGSDRRIVTKAETTVAAVRQACEVIRPGGVVAIVAYANHSGGAEELAAVIGTIQALPADRFHGSVVPPMDRAAGERLFTIRKTAAGTVGRFST